MKSKEEILEKNNCKTDIGYGHGKQLKYGITIEKIIEAMQEYTDEQCEIRDEIIKASFDRIEKYKELVEAYQELNEELSKQAYKIPTTAVERLLRKKIHELKKEINDKS